MPRYLRDVMHDYHIAWLVIDTVAVGLRLFSRGYLLRTFGADDWAMVVAYLSFFGTNVVWLLSLHFGLGFHMTEFAQDPLKLQKALKYFTVGQATYLVSSGATKISVGLLLHRIAVSLKYRVIIMTSIVVVGVWTAFTLMVYFLQCQPYSLSWGGSKTGKCLDRFLLVKVGYAFSGMDIASSWLYSLLPIPMLWNVQLPWRAKTSAMAILAIGAVSSTATIIRLRYVVKFANSVDLVFDMVHPSLWSIVELSVAILAACLSTYRPILRYLHIRGFGDSTDRPSAQKSSEPGGQYSRGHFELRSKKCNGKMGMNDITLHTAQGENDGDSQELILHEHDIYGRDIRKETKIDIEYGDTQQKQRDQVSATSVEAF